LRGNPCPCNPSAPPLDNAKQYYSNYSDFIFIKPNASSIEQHSPLAPKRDQILGLNRNCYFEFRNSKYDIGKDPQHQIPQWMIFEHDVSITFKVSHIIDSSETTVLKHLPFELSRMNFSHKFALYYFELMNKSSLVNAQGVLYGELMLNRSKPIKVPSYTRLYWFISGEDYAALDHDVDYYLVLKSTHKSVYEIVFEHHDVKTNKRTFSGYQLEISIQ